MAQNELVKKLLEKEAKAAEKLKKEIERTESLMVYERKFADKGYIAGIDGLRLFATTTAIAIGVNPAKKGFLTVEQRRQWIDACIGWRTGVRVVTFTGLAAQAAIEHGACCFVKGIRTMQDFEYEMQMAQTNHDLCGLDTTLLYTSPQLAHISSSLVRELHALGQNVRQYLPDKAPLDILP